jgi:hypothetical protein
MMSYTQDELNLIWQKLTDGTGHNARAVDVSALVKSHKLAFLQAAIAINADTEQAMMFPGSVGDATSYTDFDPPSDSTTGTYARIRGNKEGEWGVWEKR